MTNGFVTEPESLSPELVLVDPELARAERARLLELARVQPPEVSLLRLAVERHTVQDESSELTDAWRDAVRGLRERLLPAALLLAMLASGLLVAVAATHPSDDVATPPIAFKAASEPRKPAASVSGARRFAVSIHAGATKAAVERKIILLLLNSPGPTLPRRLVDPGTGLVKNNVQAVCRDTTTGPSGPSFLCVVRPLRHFPNEGLYVRYRSTPDGHGILAWDGYRRG